jgi:hypothetical protein
MIAAQAVSGPGGRPEALVISIGFAEGPIAPDVESQRAMVATLDHVDVRVLGRFAVSPARAREFGELLIRSADAVGSEPRPDAREGS